LSPFRCSAHSAGLAEPLLGTASTVRAFLLLDVPGPWGVEALQDSRLPDGLTQRLRQRCRDSGVRPLLIRRHGPRGRPRRAADTELRCFAAYADPHRPWMEATVLEQPEQVLDLPLDQLCQGRSLGLPAHPDPVFLVCTHGRHDACCAEQGRPVAAALAASHPEQTWECSHIGGDRFAANVVVLPHGLYYGRADRQSGPQIAKAHLGGRLSLDHLRGRAGYAFPVQAAEWHLRRRLDRTGAGEVVLTTTRRRGSVTEADFTVTGEPWRVSVRAFRGDAFQLTCRSDQARRPWRFELLGVEALGG
jgi:hypothetical protein